MVSIKESFLFDPQSLPRAPGARDYEPAGFLSAAVCILLAKRPFVEFRQTNGFRGRKVWQGAPTKPMQLPSKPMQLPSFQRLRPTLPLLASVCAMAFLGVFAFI